MVRQIGEIARKHVQTGKKLAKHVAKRGDHLGELVYFSSIALLEHGAMAFFGYTALGLACTHIIYTFINREHE